MLGSGTSVGVPTPGCHCAVCTSADPRDNRDATIAQAIELGQAARLEARRDQNSVGAALQKMRQLLVIPDDRAEAALMPVGSGDEFLFDRPLAGSKQRQAGARSNERINTRGEQIHSLLPGQAAHHAVERAVARF